MSGCAQAESLPTMDDQHAAALVDLAQVAVDRTIDRVARRLAKARAHDALDALLHLAPCELSLLAHREETTPSPTYDPQPAHRTIHL